jgi:hypothetical protein
MTKCYLNDYKEVAMTLDQHVPRKPRPLGRGASQCLHSQILNFANSGMMGEKKYWLSL